MVTLAGQGKQAELDIGVGNGYIQTVNASGGSKDEIIFSLEGTADGGYLSVGSTESFGCVGTDVYFIKQDSLIVNYNSALSVDKNMGNENVNVFYRTNQLIVALPETQEGAILMIYGSDLRLMKETLLKGNTTIDVSDLPPAIYICRIITGGVSARTFRVLKTD